MNRSSNRNDIITHTKNGKMETEKLWIKNNARNLFQSRRKY